MGVFEKMLKSGESLFRNSIVLDYDYLPKVIPHRKGEQEHIAMCIKPLLSNRNGRNLIITGPPGVGKTAACKHLFDEIEEETDEIYCVYINCWKKNTSYKIMADLCDQLGYKFTQNKKTDELLGQVKRIVNRGSVAFLFDEIDKVEDFDFLYMILEEIYRKAIILITNYPDWLANLDTRIKSRLTPETLEFEPYKAHEVFDILKERMTNAFVPGVWEDEAFEKIADKTYELHDVRQGLYLMREAGEIAESKASRKITTEHATKAIEKLRDFTKKKQETLDDEQKRIFDIVKSNSGQKIGDVFKIYQTKGGKANYKAFARKVKKLSDSSFISTEKITGGSEGTTTILRKAQDKKLSDF